MTNYVPRRDEVLALYAPALALARELKDAEVAGRLEESADRLARGKLLAVVCGEFKQGKSSLLNALLNEPDLFPVDVDIATNLVTSITSGPREKITILCGERGRETAEEIGRERIADYVTEQRNRDNRRQARMLLVESPNPVLRSGLTLVDTPGVGGLNVRHTDITYAFLPNADAILFVSDAMRPLGVADLKFVERLARHCENLLFVVTKIDRCAGYRAIADSNREKLASLLGRPAESIPLLAVSSRLKLDYLQTNDPEDLADSHFSEMEAALWDLLQKKRGRILLMRALVELGRAVAHMKGPLEAEWEACRQGGAQAEARESALRESRQRLQALMQNDAAWRTQLSDGLSDIRTAILTRFQDGFAQVRRRSGGCMEDAALLRDPEKIAGVLEADVNVLMTDLERGLSVEAADLHGRLETATGLNLNPFQPAPLAGSRAALSEEARVRRSSMWNKSLGMVRTGMFDATAGAVIGHIVGGALGALFGAGVGYGPGAALGAWLGGLAGGASGARKGLEQLRDKEKADVGRILAWFLDDSQRCCGVALNDAVRNMERSMRDELLQRLRAERQAAERALQSVQEVLRLTRDQAAARALEMEAPLGRLSELQARIAALADDAVIKRLPEPRPGAPIQLAPVPGGEVARPEGDDGQPDDRGNWADA